VDVAEGGLARAARSTEQERGGKSVFGNRYLVEITTGVHRGAGGAWRAKKNTFELAMDIIRSMCTPNLAQMASPEALVRF
jgi:hypothetical protein